MSLQNRVLPTGAIVNSDERGLFMGNRGILHDDTQRLGTARWRHSNWVCCRLSFNGRKRTVMTAGAYTELFFLDEAVALAAGHRPCAECRRADYRAYLDAWQIATGEKPDAKRLDRALHQSRVTGRMQRRYNAPAAGLPDGTFILLDNAPHLILRDMVLPYAPGAYLAPRPRPGGTVTVLTPAPSVAALAAGYCPQVHPSAST